MSEPLSLREARTKRQKATVYKTSRSEFRSSQNSRSEPDSPDDKEARRKIMKIDGKGIGEESTGEGSSEVRTKAQKKKIKPVVEKELDSDSEDYDLSVDEDQMIDEENKFDTDDNNDEEEEDTEESKKDDDSKDGMSEKYVINMDGEEISTDYDEILEVKLSTGDEKGSKDDDEDVGKKVDEDSVTEAKEDTVSDKKDAQEEVAKAGEGAGKSDAIVQGEGETGEAGSSNAEGGEDDEETEKLRQLHYKYLNDLYDQEFDIDDDASNEEDYYEFLSQDGGSRAGSVNSFGEDEDEFEEARGAG